MGDFSEFPVLVPGAEGESGGGEVSVDEEAAAGLHLAEEVGGGEGAVVGAFGG